MKIDFAYEKMNTKTCFEKEAWGNSEMAYYVSEPRAPGSEPVIREYNVLLCETPQTRLMTFWFNS